MLQLAKAESKKEMSLKKKKKQNNQISNNRNLTEENNFYQNQNSSRCRIEHKILKKKDMINKQNKSKNSNNDKNINTHKQNSVIFIRNYKKNNNCKIINNANNNITNNSSISTSPINKSKKIIIPKKNNINIEKCKSDRNINKNNSENKFTKNSFNRFINNKIDKIKETKKEKMLKTTENGRIRKLFCLASNIFNLEDSSTNLITKSNISPKTTNYSGIIFNTDNSNNNIYNNRNYNNILSIGKSERNTSFNRKNFFNRTEYNTSDINLLNLKGKNINHSNIESVKYDIISTKKSNIYDKYNNLSNIKASSYQIEDYELIIPKNYNKSNPHNLKNILNSKGLHIFGVKEEGDVIAGLKGKYKVKVRLNGQSERDKNKMINKASNKLMDLDIKLKRNINDCKKRKTDITGYGWDKKMKNIL